MASNYISRILRRLTPKARNAFLEGIRGIRSAAVRDEFARAFANGDADAAVQALRIESRHFRAFENVIREAILEGGDTSFKEATDQLGKNAVTVGFDSYHPRAEMLLSRHAAARVVEITEQMRATMRETITRAMATDASPRTVARLVLGDRQGGMLPLTSRQAQWVQTAFNELRSGDPAQVANYLSRKTRDRRFDKAIRRAVVQGRPVNIETVNKALQGMTSKIRRMRALTIGRTEVLGAVHAGQNEGLEQLIRNDVVSRDQIKVIWDASEDRATRHSHRSLEGETRRLGEAFTTINGAQLRFPGDSGLGAPGAETINCRCVLRPQIDRIRGLRDRLTKQELEEVRRAM